MKQEKKHTHNSQKKKKKGLGGLNVPDSKKRPCTSVIPTEDLKTKVLFMLRSKDKRHESLQRNKLDLWLFHRLVWIFISSLRLVFFPSLSASSQGSASLNKNTNLREKGKITHSSRRKEPGPSQSHSLPEKKKKEKAWWGWECGTSPLNTANPA